jgi:hypothetical protein
LKQGLARASLGIGALNFFTLGLLGLGAIIGLTLGIVAWSKARKRPNVYGGETLAIVGVALNGFWLLIAFPIVISIAIPNLLAAREAAYENAAIHSLRSISEAEVTYFRAHGRIGMLPDLSADNLIKSDLATGRSYGYSFLVRPGIGNSGTLSFVATAVPADEFSGRRSFLIDETGVMRVSEIRGREASRPLQDSRSSLRSDDD